MNYPPSLGRTARIKAFAAKHLDEPTVLVNMCLLIYPDGQVRLRERNEAQAWAASIRIPSGCLRSTLDAWLATPAVQSLRESVAQGFRPAALGEQSRLGLTAAGLAARGMLEGAAQSLPLGKTFHATSWFRGIPLDFAWRPGESLSGAVARAHRQAGRLNRYLVGNVKEALLLHAERLGDLRVDQALESEA